MRLKAFLVVFLILATATLFSCNRQKSGGPRLLIYTPHGQDMLRDFIGRYKQQNPGADIQFLAGRFLAPDGEVDAVALPAGFHACPKGRDAPGL